MTCGFPATDGSPQLNFGRAVFSRFGPSSVPQSVFVAGLATVQMRFRSSIEVLRLRLRIKGLSLGIVCATEALTQLQYMTLNQKHLGLTQFRQAGSV